MSIQNQNPHDGGFVHIFFWLPKSTVELPLSTLKPRNKGCQETREYQIPLYMYSSHLKLKKKHYEGTISVHPYLLKADFHYSWIHFSGMLLLLLNAL